MGSEEGGDVAAPSISRSLALALPLSRASSGEPLGHPTPPIEACGNREHVSADYVAGNLAIGQADALLYLLMGGTR